MTALSSKNCSFQHQLRQSQQPLDASCLLFLILLGKVLLNILILRVKRKDTRWTLMEYFCFSLAFVDLLLLVNISILTYFRDFVVLGIRFTNYHICLLTQIISFTYGFLHYPVCSLACIDYWCNLSRATKHPSRWQKLLYFLTVILTWISVLAYVLSDPAISVSLKAHRAYVSPCPSYVSAQSHWLSLSMLMVLFVAFLISWQEVVALIQAMRIASYRNKAVLYFPFPPHSGYIVSSREALLPRLIVCFLGTWFPFVVLQVLILSLGVQIPAYIEMNVPWLYFVNSFLIAAVYWFNCHKLYLRDSTLPVDPFINWKCCFVPVHRLKQVERPISIIIC
ncbi:probable G-protein coupled receptor 160 [Mastomys coucha]|uniref:probable G-protein coupled receptor 160 n=1 Tax=Mastomys coucha TaxID=35658 RepID=UPI0012617469|nr:probable G-protein coupled receptor 160 [Mastomys coucha]XP_031232363.1 probable G-protein coupled receptor 160 [Mastomys coucha]XP_031232364.1 probable G-protein coupled receptor 160 [Mastomys coucha]XP_031232365.1 probable G-protein coupled receptor 160 [Mastomys coucha]XP_031232366.1 probable G-protein coupled receptor 160 [Mastomys coucha]XP_031232367.1 probable G-protein coupled receptor 160 [Mastomys coucha]XP_031232368.1 probable G-protein coupled receptor 160 [Mastomys coucha]XP_0